MKKEYKTPDLIVTTFDNYENTNAVDVSNVATRTSLDALTSDGTVISFSSLHS